MTPKRLGVHLVKRVEVGQVDQEECGLHHPVEVGARGLQHGPKVREDLDGLLLDATGDDLHARRVKRKLARGIDEVAHRHRLAVRTIHLGCLIGVGDSYCGHGSSY